MGRSHPVPCDGSTTLRFLTMLLFRAPAEQHTSTYERPIRDSLKGRLSERTPTLIRTRFQRMIR